MLGTEIGEKNYHSLYWLLHKYSGAYSCSGYSGVALLLRPQMQVLREYFELIHHNYHHEKEGAIIRASSEKYGAG